MDKSEFERFWCKNRMNQATRYVATIKNQVRNKTKQKSTVTDGRGLPALYGGLKSVIIEKNEAQSEH